MDINKYMKNPERFGFEIDQISKSLLGIIGQTLQNNLKETNERIPIVEIYAEVEAILISRMIKNTYAAINLAIDRSNENNVKV